MTTRYGEVFVAEGAVLELVAPYTVSGGSGAKVGTSLFGVAMMDIASAATGPFAMEGLFKLAKTTSQAWTAGDRLYWDDSGKKLTTDATAGLFVGVCTVAAGSSDATGYCRLNEGAPGLNSGSQGTLADLTDNSGGASADGTIGVITLPTLAGWNGSTDPTAAEATQIITACTESRDAVKELATKLNALLAKLRLAGILT